MTCFCERKIRQTQITTIALTVTILTNHYYDFLRKIRQITTFAR